MRDTAEYIIGTLYSAWGPAIMIDSSKTMYQVNIPTDSPKVMGLLTAYDLVVTIPPGVEIRLGRFSSGLLSRFRLLVNADDGCVFEAGSFCEAARDSTIILGGEHRNHALLNFTFGGPSSIFKLLMSPEDRALTGTAAAERTVLGDDVVISAGAVILAGAQVETGSVIGAGAVVAGRCDGYGIFGGVPARRLKDRFSGPMQEAHRATRMADICAHDLPRLPSLLDRLGRQDIDIDGYLSSVSFLPARPRISLSGQVGPEEGVLLTGVTGYALGGQEIVDGSTLEKLNAYFGQIWNRSAEVRWTPDIFLTLGLY